MSRSKRKRAWRLSQIAKTGRAIGGGCWILHMPSKGGPLSGMFPAIIGEPLGADAEVVSHDENEGAT